MTGAQKDVELLLDQLRQAGCIVLRRPAGRHIKVLGPNGRCIFISNTPGASSAPHCVRRDAKRHLGVALS